MTTTTNDTTSGHKCRHCAQRIDLTHDQGTGITQWVHDHTGENYCADRAISARPQPEPTPEGMPF